MLVGSIYVLVNHSATMQPDPDDFDFEIPSKRKICSPEKRCLTSKVSSNPKPRVIQRYEVVHRFPSLQAFKQWQVDTNFCSLWGVFRSHQTILGPVTTYYCKDNKACPAILRVEVVSLRGEEGSAVIAKKNSFAHIHGNVESDDEFTKRGLPSAVKQAAVYCIDKHDYTERDRCVLCQVGYQHSRCT